ncbi:unnamed protein product [Tuber melanosporum]|uniref:(Perigord truffle) hypothetical protein n=1 Tax=Tuber melanosporum (strain Mel28) TaxID=656061 RepID=D5GKW6_TUBMM|nr:uncharacterized protein GSTUM_00009799001 [Tuber melanosporum]CAZ85159.1 unnamed protein product [Tuber melanosporum]
MVPVVVSVGPGPFSSHPSVTVTDSRTGKEADSSILTASHSSFSLKLLPHQLHHTLALLILSFSITVYLTTLSIHFSTAKFH